MEKMRRLKERRMVEDMKEEHKEIKGGVGGGKWKERRMVEAGGGEEGGKGREEQMRG